MGKVRICPVCRCINKLDSENANICCCCNNVFETTDVYNEEDLNIITQKKCPKCGTLNDEDCFGCINCHEDLMVSSISSFKFIKGESDSIKQESNDEYENSQENCSINATIVDIPEQNIRILELITTDSEILKILPSKNIVLGRSGNIRPELFASYRTVSREHLYVKFEEERWFILDTKSLNGTYINGEKIEKGIQCEIKKGDKISLSTKFTIIVRSV